MLKRNLIYTGITRGKSLVVLVGQKKALAMAIKGKQVSQRWSMREESPGIWPEEALPLRDYSRLVLLTLPD